MKVTPWINTLEFEETGEALLSALDLFSPASEAITTESSSSNQNGPLTNNCDDLNNNINAWNNLIGTDPSERPKHAIHRVAIWRSRCAQGRLPLAIDTTASISELLLKDTNRFSSNANTNSFISKKSNIELRLAYSSALIRGVNGLADASNRNYFNNNENSNNNLSVALLCDRLGLPRWIVDMRHDASHSSLPSLPCLRMGCRTILGYLGERYWGKLKEKRNQLRENARNLLLKSCHNASTNVVDDIERREKKDQEFSQKDNELKPKKMSPTKYAKEYVNKIPIDIGLDVALEYLVIGKETFSNSSNFGETHNSTMCKGAFSQYNTILETPSSVDDKNINDPLLTFNTKIVTQFLPILKALQNSCCGFLNALLIELVHAIISTNVFDDSSKKDETANKEVKGTMQMNSPNWNMFSWIQYILSYEFNCILNNEKKSKESYPSFFVSHSTLQTKLHINLNPICDLCMEFLEQNNQNNSLPKYNDDGFGCNLKVVTEKINIITKLLRLFKSILGVNRTERYGLPNTPYPINKKRKRELDIQNAELDLQMESSKSIYVMDNQSCVNTTAINGKDNEIENKSVSSPNQKLSLEEIEDLLDSDDNDGDDNKKDLKLMNKKESVDAIGLIEPGSDENSITNNQSWAYCKNWDPCPIGSLPGHTSTMLF